MYLDHFQFDVEPFALAPDANFLYLGDAHKKALNYLKYALWNRDSFTLITGAIGAGKTILLQCLLKTIPESIHVISINQTQVSPIEFLEMLVDYLELEKPQYPTKPNLYKILRAYFDNLGNESVVFIIDEAQGMPIETFEELRLLATNDFEDKNININVILCGQPELKAMIESPQLEQLNQRIRLKFELNGLNSSETTKYIAYRLAKAGQSLEIFSKNSLARIYNFTKGVPRKINKLCDTALICAFAAGSNSITVKQIDEAVKELQWKERETKKETKTSKTNVKSQVEDNIIRLQPAKIEDSFFRKNLLQYARSIDMQLSKIAISLRIIAEGNDDNS